MDYLFMAFYVIGVFLLAYSISAAKDPEPKPKPKPILGGLTAGSANGLDDIQSIAAKVKKFIANLTCGVLQQFL